MTKINLDSQISLFLEQLLPRILTQVCRDPGSPGYGSFDRNWWHYKIRDFSSIILQQGGYTLHCAAQLPQFQSKAGYLKDIAAAACQFWNRSATRYGAFEEYYPWEQGYPPVAFTTLAVTKMVNDRVIDKSTLLPGLTVASKQLLSHFESKATNQQVAGMAALCWIQKIIPELVDRNAFNVICEKTLACQHNEGWYMEYGGPDLGYLSVTMDCLWDAYDATGDKRFRDSAAKALNFIASFVALPQRGAGMHNARNTDYIVPYGIARFLSDERNTSLASGVLSRILENMTSSDHFHHAIDDRYYCHYIGHSFFRAAEIMGKADTIKLESKECWYEGTGHWLRPETLSGCAALVSTKKGGIISLDFAGAPCYNFGWIVQSNNKEEWVSHWWTDSWVVDRQEDRIQISGYMVPHRETISSPFKHIVLRGLSFVFGRRIIDMLKEKMIFKENHKQGPSFCRTIVFSVDAVIITDVIGADSSARLIRAPRSSKRHVASADSYHFEDMTTQDTTIEIEESHSMNNGSFEITTVYRRKP